MKKLLGYGLPLAAALGLIVGITLQCIGQQPGPPDDGHELPLPKIECIGNVDTDAPHAGEPSFWVQAHVYTWVDHLQHSPFLYHWYQVEFRWAASRVHGPHGPWWEPQLGEGPGGLFKRIPDGPHTEFTQYPGWWDYYLALGAGDADDIELARHYDGVEFRVKLWGSNNPDPEYISLGQPGDYMFELASDTWWAPMTFGASVPTKPSDHLGFETLNYLTGEWIPAGDEEEGGEEGEEE